MIDKIHTTATSHGRVFIVELMGHSAGWLTLYAGVAGGADIILLPELPFDTQTVCDAIRRRNQQSKRFSIIAVAEGAVSNEMAQMDKKKLAQYRSSCPHPSIAYELADELGKATGQEIRVTIPGHYQRGGQPSPYDRILATRFGTTAAELVLRSKFGIMVGMQNNQVVPVPLKDVAGKLKLVPPDSPVIASARALGTSFGTI